MQYAHTYVYRHIQTHMHTHAYIHAWHIHTYKQWIVAKYGDMRDCLDLLTRGNQIIFALSRVINGNGSESEGEMGAETIWNFKTQPLKRKFKKKILKIIKKKEKLSERFILTNKKKNIFLANT